MDRKSAPRTRMRAAMEFSSFRNPIGIPRTTNVTMSEACRRLTPLSRSYKARATKIKPAWPMSWPAMPRRKSVSEAAMLLAVAAAFPWTISLPGTYIMAMKLSLYVTLGIFLLLAARDPSANRSLIAFTAWSSFAHAGLMVVQAFRNFIPRTELLGVALFAVIGVTLIVLAPAKQSMQPASAVGA